MIALWQVGDLLELFPEAFDGSQVWEVPGTWTEDASRSTGGPMAEPKTRGARPVAGMVGVWFQSFFPPASQPSSSSTEDSVQL